MSEFRSPRARVIGRGAGGDGTGHFIAQRASALALLILAPWFALSAAFTIRSYTDALAFVRNDVNALGLILLLIVGAAHMRLGMQTVIEDYIAAHGTRIALLLLNAALCFGAALIGVWAVLRINFGW